jgi:hypothetical protein
VILLFLVPLSDYTLPPIRYQGDNTVVVTFAKPELVQELCGRHGVPELIGCANLIPPSMVVPNPCDPAFRNEVFARIACHEKAHSLGWSYKHED